MADPAAPLDLDVIRQYREAHQGYVPGSIIVALLAEVERLRVAIQQLTQAEAELRLEIKDLQASEQAQRCLREDAEREIERLRTENDNHRRFIKSQNDTLA